MAHHHRTPPFIRVPGSTTLPHFYEAAEAVEAKIRSNVKRIDDALLSINPSYEGARVPAAHYPPEYWVEWFHRKSDSTLSYLQVYAYILTLAIPSQSRPLRELRLLDFGAGWGLMSLIAKQAGVGHVTYLDNDPGVAAAGRAIAEALNLDVDHYICDNEEGLTSRPDAFDVVVSSDVLEHIYDTSVTFDALRVATSRGGRVVLHTGANPLNVYQRFQLGRLHTRYETQDPATLAELHRTGGKALWERRLEVIRKNLPDLSPESARQLAIASRGLDERGIIRACRRFVESATLPVPDHPTNTCDPSGYWYERLMDPYAVAEQLRQYGFQSRVAQSYWGPGRTRGVSLAIKHALNFISSLGVRPGLRATFYYSIVGDRQ